MASRPRKRGSRWEVVFKRAGVLDKPLYLFYESESAALEDSRRVDALLSRGIVPTEQIASGPVITLSGLIGLYERDAHPSQKDREVLATVCRAKGATPVVRVTIRWADDWVTEMKRLEHLVPGTIRAKVGAVGRAWDWGQRKGHIASDGNPFRGMPDGYADYTELDGRLAGGARTDTERSRRLEGGEEARIRAVIASGVLPRRQRPYQIPHPDALERDFTLALESAMRLRERYTLEVHQVRLHQRTIYLDRTKNGDSRAVPLSSVAMAAMEEQIRGRAPEERVFPWWDGDRSPRGLKLASNFLSSIYARIFDAAGCPDLTEHDLRHEATSRFFERTGLAGEAIMKITGHRSHQMLMRYLSLRGSDLARQLW